MKNLLLIVVLLFLVSCAKEQVNHRYIVWDNELKKILYCPTEQECERIRKIYKEGLNQ